MIVQIDIVDVLHFWFGADAEVPREKQRLWWKKSLTFDAEIKKTFGCLHAEVAEGRHEFWAENAKGRLALILIFDQFSRHLYRGQARAYAYDKKALDLCLDGIEEGHDQELEGFCRAFYYMPLVHCENASIQEKAVQHLSHYAQTQSLAEKDAMMGFVRSARRHQCVIEQFGRFPHRNVLLGRENNDREKEFLKQPGSSF